jgi:hypothetical protein
VASSGVGLAGFILIAATGANAQSEDRDKQQVLLHGSSKKTKLGKILARMDTQSWQITRSHRKRPQWNRQVVARRVPRRDVSRRLMDDQTGGRRPVLHHQDR